MLDRGIEMGSAVSSIGSPTVDQMGKTRIIPRKEKKIPSESLSKPSRGLILGGVGALAAAGLALTTILFMGGGNNGGNSVVDRPLDVVVGKPVTPEVVTAWARAEALDTESAYEDFLSNWVDSQYAAAAKAALERLKVEADDKAFAEAQSKDLVSAYGKYVQDYPLSLIHI